MFCLIQSQRKLCWAMNCIVHKDGIHCILISSSYIFHRLQQLVCVVPFSLPLPAALHRSILSIAALETILGKYKTVTVGPRPHLKQNSFVAFLGFKIPFLRGTPRRSRCYKSKNHGEPGSVRTTLETWRPGDKACLRPGWEGCGNAASRTIFLHGTPKTRTCCKVATHVPPRSSTV
jgi:hypothetical protein